MSKRYRSFCFTSFKIDLDQSIDRDRFGYLIMQQEICPDTGRAHWQGYAELKVRTRMSSVKAYLGDDAVHIEDRRGTAEEASEYCRKIESAMPGTLIEFGSMRAPSGTRTDLSSMYSMIKEGKSNKEICDFMPSTYMRYYRSVNHVRQVMLEPTEKKRSVEVVVHFGATGTGKTSRVIDKYELSDVYILDQPNGGSLWFDGYVGQPVLLIDDFYGWIRHSQLLRILDGYNMRLPVKGSYTYAKWSKVYITSNKYPGRWYKFGLSEALCRRINECLSFVELGVEPMSVMLSPTCGDAGDE